MKDGIFNSRPVSPSGLAGDFTSLTASGLFTLTGTEDGLTAHAGGTQAAALALSATKNYHRISVCATAGDSVALPAATVGQNHFVRNDGAAAAQMYGTTPDTINGVATATGVSLPAGTGQWYTCVTAAKWVTIRGTALAELTALGGGAPVGTGVVVLATAPTFQSTNAAPVIFAGVSASGEVTITTDLGATNAYINFRNTGDATHTFTVGRRNDDFFTIASSTTGTLMTWDVTGGWNQYNGKLTNSTSITATTFVKVGSYTVGTLPSASTAGAGASVYCTDAVGGAVMVDSNATNWKLSGTQVTVS